MKVIANGLTLPKLVEDFARRFPKLTTKGGSWGKCKFMSYELALYLRRRGIKAKIIHVQGLKNLEFRKTAHSSYLDKKNKDWSHYCVGVGSAIIDLTARQFDSSLEFPRYMTRAELASEWEIVEYDSFVNRMVQEVLLSQMDANRNLKAAPVKKIDITPRSEDGGPVQQQLRPAPV